ncbi:MAG: hypothetical protein BalsKO_31270 [Balneolaceae bacterium]
MPAQFIQEDGPCSIDFIIPNGIPSSVIFVHSHPYKNGEVQNACEAGNSFIYRTYPVKDKDKRTLDKLGVDKGVYIDAEKIIVYDKKGRIIQTTNRCGY